MGKRRRSFVKIHTHDSFSVTECQELNRRYGNPLNPNQLRELHNLLDGQPYLTRLAFYHLTAEQLLSFPDVEANAANRYGRFGIHLRALEAKLRKDDRLLKAMKTICVGGKEGNPEILQRLRSAGLITKDDFHPRPANFLYKRFFGELP